MSEWRHRVWLTARETWNAPSESALFCNADQSKRLSVCVHLFILFVFRVGAAMAE